LDKFAEFVRAVDHGAVQFAPARVGGFLSMGTSSFYHSFAHRSRCIRFIRRSSVVIDAFYSMVIGRSRCIRFDGHRSFSMHSMHSTVIGRSRCIRCIRWSSVVLDAFDAFDGDGHRSFSMHSIRSMVIGRSRCIRFVRYVEANFPGARPCDRRSTFDALDAFDALARASARR
jgi:hypothetical protein